MSMKSAIAEGGTLTRRHDDRRRPRAGKGCPAARRREAHGRRAVHIEGHRALRRAVRLTHARNEVLGHEGPHGGYRAAGGDLARRRPPRHRPVPGRHVRGGFPPPPPPGPPPRPPPPPPPRGARRARGGPPGGGGR